MATYYLGVKFGNDNNPDQVSAGTSSVGSAVDTEVRIDTTNGLTRKGVIEALIVITEFVNGNGANGAGANLPAL